MTVLLFHGAGSKYSNHTTWSNVNPDSFHITRLPDGTRIVQFVAKREGPVELYLSEGSTHSKAGSTTMERKMTAKELAENLLAYPDADTLKIRIRSGVAGDDTDYAGYFMRWDDNELLLISKEDFNRYVDHIKVHED